MDQPPELDNEVGTRKHVRVFAICIADRVMRNCEVDTAEMQTDAAAAGTAREEQLEEMREIVLVYARTGVGNHHEFADTVEAYASILHETHPIQRVVDQIDEHGQQT
jgi:hypothetical protein